MQCRKIIVRDPRIRRVAIENPDQGRSGQTALLKKNILLREKPTQEMCKKETGGMRERRYAFQTSQRLVLSREELGAAR